MITRQKRGFGLLELLVLFVVVGLLVIFGGIYFSHKNADNTPSEVKSLLEKAEISR